VPTFDRPEQLARCLDGLARLEPPPGGFEIVVVDDGGNRPAAPVVAARSWPVEVRLLRRPNTGPAGARNDGAAAAAGSHLAFTDDDCVPDRRWLLALDAAAARAPAALIGGRTRNAVTGDRCAEASQILVDHVTAYGGVQPRFFASNNLATPARSFAAVGGFDVRFPRPAGEDRELADRWAAAGLPLAAEPGALVWHHHAMRLRSFYRQHHNYGRGAFHFHRVRAERSGGGIRLEGPRFYTGLVRRPFRDHHLREATVLSGLLVLAQVANAAGFAAEASRHLRRRSGRGSGTAQG
jgi:GT2 family glycosyltransferase